MPKPDIDQCLNLVDLRLLEKPALPRNWRREKRERRKGLNRAPGPDYAYMPRELLAAMPWAATFRDVVWLIQAEFSMNGPQPFRLPNALLKEFGISRKTKMRALAELEARGVIKVQYGDRKAPIVNPSPAHWRQFQRNPKSEKE